jgi:hypothetical protein
MDHQATIIRGVPAHTLNHVHSNWQENGFADCLARHLCARHAAPAAPIFR